MSNKFHNPLTISLPDALAKGVKHSIDTLRGGDQLHVKAAMLGFPKGAVLPIAGTCCTVDLDGRVVNVVAYVLPVAATAQVVAFTERDYRRFPCALYREMWFGTPPVCLVEVDLTDYADCLKLERQPEALARLLYPEAEFSYLKAA
ncbi:hypothetical protein [Hymenobacter negativus]|uniref:ASCH domain-containing protein n=1 Tax=Hymenobacter negativus TaxID=2795026 RepID=A0ABS3QD86_9BACT|nr:hypothetical protein [Hymenobacter negativus]MBO2009207.1 hypothetical protein [Hymenobacter negativus]